MAIKLCETCKTKFTTDTNTIYCETGNDGKCKKIGYAKKHKIRREELNRKKMDPNYFSNKEKREQEKKINPYFLSRGEISNDRVQFSLMQD